MNPDRRHWGWYLSSLFYKRTYFDIGHQLDEDLFAYLGDRTKGAVVADCGCGPGVVTGKFLKREAARVLAIDVSAAMLHQVRTSLANAIAVGQVVSVRKSFAPELFFQLRHQFLGGAGLDIILFKRSLYVEQDQALDILQAAVENLNPGGVLAVIHPERLLRRYAFGPGLRPKHYTLFHLFNRAVSKLGEKLGIGDYTLYTQEELLNLLRTAGAGRQVELIPSEQQAYNLVAIRN